MVNITSKMGFTSLCILVFNMREIGLQNVPHIFESTCEAYINSVYINTLWIKKVLINANKEKLS